MKKVLILLLFITSIKTAECQQIERYKTYMLIAERLPRVDKDKMNGEVKASNEIIYFDKQLGKINVYNDDKDEYLILKDLAEFTNEKSPFKSKILKASMVDKRGGECTGYIETLPNDKTKVLSFEFVYENIRIVYMVSKIE